MCKHERGDWITEMGFWLCVDCYARLESRPVKYGMVPIFGATSAGGNIPALMRQDVVWMAEIAKFEGVTFYAFIRTMAKRIMRRTRPAMDEAEAFDVAISILQDLGDQFGDAAYDWSHEGARDLVDEEMQHWDKAESGN